MQKNVKKKLPLLLAFLFLIAVCIFAYLVTNSYNLNNAPDDPYQDFYSVSVQDAFIPGLDEGLVPQGLGYVSSQDWIVISYYNDDGSPSVLSFVNASTYEYVKSVKLYNTDQTPFIGHCGGVSASEQNVWVASDNTMFRIPLADIVNASDGSQITFKDQFMSPSTAAFSFYTDGVLWCGEFYYPEAYPTDETHYIDVSGGTNHALISGYKLDKATDLLPAGKYIDASAPVTPDYLISIPDRIQGADILSDGSIMLSQSYGRNNDSTLLLYNDVLSQIEDTTLNINDTEVPVWYLDRTDRISRLKAPPMTEGIVQKDPGFIYVLFESGAQKYSDGKYPLYNIFKTSVD